MIGMSPLDYARNSISLAIAGEDWASRLVGNGGKPTGVLMYDRISEYRAARTDPRKV
jgi:phage portal protein BeeE